MKRAELLREIRERRKGATPETARRLGRFAKAIKMYQDARHEIPESEVAAARKGMDELGR